MNKTQLKQLFIDYTQAQEHCKTLEKDAREARSNVDNYKDQIVNLYKDGIKLVTGNFEAVVVTTERDGYVVRPSTRTSVTIKTK